MMIYKFRWNKIPKHPLNVAAFHILQ